MDTAVSQEIGIETELNEFKLVAWSCQRAARAAVGGILRRKEYVGANILYYEVELHTGEKRQQLVIPKICTNVARLIAKHYHRRNVHRGRKFDLSALASSHFYIESVWTAVSHVIQNCLLCSLKNAGKDRRYATAIHVVPRELSLPALSRVSIDFAHCKRQVILSMVCLDTLYVSFVKVKDTTADAAWYGLQKLSRVYSVDFRLVHSDNARALSSLLRKKVLKTFPNCQCTTTAPYASSQNPVERTHQELWRFIRSRKFGKLLSENGHLDSDVLEEAASILNRRPLGTTTTGQVITPALLAFGSTHSATGIKILFSLRKYFYENCFLEMRRRHLPNRHMRRYSVSVGDWVLCQERGHTEKDEFKYYIARIAKIDHSVIEVELHGEKKRRLQSNQVVPISMLEGIDASPGGHVVENAGEAFELPGEVNQTQRREHVSEEERESSEFL
jgi:hypothetical protein